MLEVSHLSKIYKTKGGADVKALDDVSVRFPETGMVFLLGKSGSGKSTLLNVCGGLDAPSGGEIIVKGRSSKNFSQSDFDSYRNTFIGFIFQEYNILNEFSVEDNIALALELQGKPKDKAAINKLLEEVDLTGYAKRKPNTLSGGQKQRIAIARALVKAPEIIMADEPTGALDSATGKQVFDTLKKLSKDKLVIVVSHDRDFAEQYGDRVIELKDGKIISDVSKTQEPQKSISANVTAIGDTLCVKKGASLSDKDFEEIKAFLKGADGDIVIATGEKDVKTFKEVSRITDKGEKEVFRDTDENKFEKKAYKPEDSKFIRSKLPMRHAMKIGASGLKTKPFRLIFTVLLSTIAFVMFGLFSTMMLYDKESTLYQSSEDSGTNILRVTKKYKLTHHNQSSDDDIYTYDEECDSLLTQAEVNELAATFGNEAFGALYLSKSWSGFVDTKTINFTTTEEVGAYYQPDLAFVAYVPENHAMRQKIRAGNYPAADNEICISSYTASVLIKYKLDGAQDENALLNKEFSLSLNGLGNVTFKISGIFESNDGELSQKYSSLQATTTHQDEDAKELQEKLENELKDGLHLVAFLNENMLTTFKKYSTSSTQTSVFQALRDYKYSLCYYSNDNYDEHAYYLKNSEIPEGYSLYLKNGKTSLSDNEVLVSPNVLLQILNNEQNVISQAESEYNEMKAASSEPVSGDFWEFYNGYIPSEEDEAYYNGYQIYLQIMAKDEYKSALEKQNALNKTVAVTLFEKEYEYSLRYWLEYSAYGYFYGEGQEITLASEDKQSILSQIASELETLSFTFTGKAMSVEGESTAIGRGAKELKIVGFLLSESDYHISLSDEVYEHFKTISDAENPGWNSVKSWTETKYVQSADAIYNTVFLPYDSSLKSQLTAFTYNYAEDDSRLCLSNTVASALELVNSMVDELSTVFMWIGIVMAVFAALLLSNFISVSISHKKRDIGILRAVGARSFDVFKIFFSESFLIAIISIIISMIGCFVACSVLNQTMSNALSGVSLFVFGPVSILILVGVAVVTAIVATFLPVYNAAKKKPVDSIRAL